MNLKSLRKFIIIFLVIYLVLVVSFYFLTGHQLKYRQSDGNIKMPEHVIKYIDLVEGVTIEQRFSAPIEVFDSVSVRFSTSLRTNNSGKVTMQLLKEDGTLLASQSKDAKDFVNEEIYTLRLDKPRDDLYNVPLIIRIYADSNIDNCVSLSLSPKFGNDTFVLNNYPEATIFFSASGEDLLWIGSHYWFFAVGGFVLFSLIFAYCYLRLRKGKQTLFVKVLSEVKKYKFLIKTLVSRDFKTKYKRSVLGIFWSFLNPLLIMIVQYFVFSKIFKADIKLYPAYLLIGIVSFNFFSEATNMCLTSVTGNSSLITKVYVPKYIYPLTRLMSSTINLAISLIPLSIVGAITGVGFSKSIVLALYFWLCLIIFVLGLGLLLSASMVFFRDTQFLWGVLSMIWMYATPIFYPENIIPEKFRIIQIANPLYHFLKNARICILDGISPEPISYVISLSFALGMLIVGSFVFKKTQDKFLLYI